MFFRNWQDLVRIVVVGGLAYVGLIVLLRISGKRTLAKMNAFDFLVTVAMGSILATALLSPDVALAEAITAFAMLVLLQFIVAWLSVRSTAFRDWVRAKPTILFYQGQFLYDQMRNERVLDSRHSRGHAPARD